MKTILVDDELYAYLVGQTQEIGESASTILRRLLGLSGVDSRGGEVNQDELKEVFSFLADWEHMRRMTQTRKFLHILGWAYCQHQGDFSKVFTIQGSRRKYFAASEQELIESGKSTNPRPIPYSPFWVVTNFSTARKQEILSEALRILGYESNLIAAMLARI